MNEHKLNECYMNECRMNGNIYFVCMYHKTAINSLEESFPTKHRVEHTCEPCWHSNYEICTPHCQGSERSGAISLHSHPCITGPVNHPFASLHKGPGFKTPGGYLCETGILLLALSHYKSTIVHENMENNNVGGEK